MYHVFRLRQSWCQIQGAPSSAGVTQRQMVPFSDLAPADVFGKSKLSYCRTIALAYDFARPFRLVWEANRLNCGGMLNTPCQSSLRSRSRMKLTRYVTHEVAKCSLFPFDGFQKPFPTKGLHFRWLPLLSRQAGAERESKPIARSGLVLTAG
jgi:hypothetical protein